MFAHDRVQTNYKENTKDLYYWCLIRGMHQSQVDSICIRLIMQKKRIPYYDIIVVSHKQQNDSVMDLQFANTKE